LVLALPCAPHRREYDLAARRIPLDGAGGSFYFVDPQDDLLVVFMVQARRKAGGSKLALKTIMFEELGKGLRKIDNRLITHGVSRDRLAIERRASAWVCDASYRKSTW